MTRPTPPRTPSAGPTTGPSGVNPLAVLAVEVAEGLRAILREPTALFFSVLMPVLFFALFAGLFGDAPDETGLPAPVVMLARFGAFGVVSVMLLNPGLQVADERTRGWLRIKKVSAAPVGVSLAAKVLAALPYALGVLLALSAVTLAISGPALPPGRWLALVGVLLLGSLPFALIGLAVGFVARTETAAALLNAVMFPMVIASGLWMPLSILPGWVSAIAPFLPTYHLAELAMAQLTGAPAVGHVLALLVMTAVGGLLAGVAYRNLRV